MTKYTRSIQKLTELIQDIFQVPGLSIDTKAIVLVLAATMDSAKFEAMINPLENLAAIRSKLIEVNEIRYKGGNLYRDYIVLSALQVTKCDINSDELQQFISNVPGEVAGSVTAALNPEISLEVLEAEKNWHEKTDPQSFAVALDRAARFLLEKLNLQHNDHLQTIADAYLYCRSIEKPLVAYYAVIYAMAEILTFSGLDEKYALLYSYKLAKHALSQFTQYTGKENAILHAYNTNTSLNS